MHDWTMSDADADADEDVVMSEYRPMPELQLGLAGSREGSIHELPVEILSNIFIWLKISFPLYPPNFLAWSPILLVSRRWCQVAINCPQLWTELDLSLNIPQFYLDNSCAQPLTLYRCDRRSRCATLARYSALFPRARRLYFAGMPKDNGAPAFHGITSLPLLEELTIYLTSKSPSAEVFASGNFPNLVSLKLFLSRDSELRCTGFTPNLRSLVIDGVTLDRALKVSDLLYGLQNMPLLERFRLTNAFAKANETVDSTASVVQLQRLKFLSLNGLLEGCTALLECLRFPPSTNIDVRCPLLIDNAGQLLTREDAIPRLSEALATNIASRDSSGTLLSPMKYMLLQDYLYANTWLPGYGDRTTVVTKLCLMRNDKPFGESLQRNLQFFEGIWRERYNLNYDTSRDNFQGVQVLLSCHLAWSIIRDAAFQPLRIRLPRWMCQALPLEQVTTVALDLHWHTSLMGIGRLCPNVTTVLASNEKQGFEPNSYGLRDLLDVDKDGRRLKRLHFPKMQTLVLDRRIAFSKLAAAFVDLKYMHDHLKNLSVWDVSTLEKICIVASPDVDSTDSSPGGTLRNSPNALRIWMRDFKADFPHIGVVMLDYEFSEWSRV